MAYTGTICAEAEMTFFAGEHVDATGNTEANHNYLAGYAESYISCLLQYDVVTNWSKLNTIYKKLISEWAARFAAISLISYNMGTWIANSTRIEAEDLINVHWARCQQIENLLKEKAVKDFLGV